MQQSLQNQYYQKEPTSELSGPLWALLLSMKCFIYIFYSSRNVGSSGLFCSTAFSGRRECVVIGLLRPSKNAKWSWFSALDWGGFRAPSLMFWANVQATARWEVVLHLQKLSCFVNSGIQSGCARSLRNQTFSLVNMAFLMSWTTLQVKIQVPAANVSRG